MAPRAATRTQAVPVGERSRVCHQSHQSTRVANRTGRRSPSRSRVCSPNTTLSARGEAPAKASTRCPFSVSQMRTSATSPLRCSDGFRLPALPFARVEHLAPFRAVQLVVTAGRLMAVRAARRSNWRLALLEPFQPATYRPPVRSRCRPRCRAPKCWRPTPGDIRGADSVPSSLPAGRSAIRSNSSTTLRICTSALAGISRCELIVRYCGGTLPIRSSRSE
jgi:hypothetical protein